MESDNDLSLLNYVDLMVELRQCKLCDKELPCGARPVVQVSQSAKLLIVGQAPGIRVHETGIPFNDPSGDRLRDWLGLDKNDFYDEEHVAIVPMGFCYPGTGKGGDLPPRTECAQTWRKPLLQKLTNVELTLVIGRYAIDWHLPDCGRSTVAAIVKGWKNNDPGIIPLPHPSPRNNRWLKQNSWFETELVPYLKERVAALKINSSRFSR